jgi:hypothetical protein
MTITVGTNSYITRAAAIAYAAERGVTLADTAATDVLLIKATDYMETLEGRYRGTRTDADQALAWPRSGAIIRGYEADDETVPALVEQVQKELVLDLNGGVDLYNRTDRQHVTRERVDGAVEVAYAEPSVVGERVIQSQAMALIRQITRGQAIILERS